MASVTYRRVGDRWHIRFREKGRKEIVHTHPGTIPERTIVQRTQWWREQISLGRENPWDQAAQAQLEQLQGMRLSEAIDRYLAAGIESGRWKVDSKGRSKTEQTYRERLGYFLQSAGDIQLSELSADQVQRHIRDYRGNEYSKKVNLSSINTFLGWLHTQGMIEQLIKVTLPKAVAARATEIERDVRGITIYDLKRVCAGVRIRERQIQANKYAGHWKSREWAIKAFFFVFATMLRREEIPHVYPEDVTHDLSHITIGNLAKPGRPRFEPKGGIKTIPTTSLMRQALELLDVRNMKRGRPIIDRSADQVYRKLVEAAGIVFPGRRIRLHDLRHGGIMYYRSLGWPESLISQLARHASSQVTSMMYDGVDPAALRRTLQTYDSRGPGHHPMPQKLLEDTVF